jgi:hypothetical protein
VKAAPPAAVARIATQLGVEAGALGFYASRDQTRTDHLKLVATRLGWQAAEDNQRAGWKVLREFLVDRAIERDVPSVLFRLAVEYLSSDEVRIIRPGVWPLMDEISSARREADHQINRLVQPLLTGQRVADLDGVLEVEPEMVISRITWLHRGCTSYSPSSIRAEVDKLVFLRGLNIHTLDLSMIPESRRRQLAGLGRRLRNQALKDRKPITKYPILLSTLTECYVEVLDEIVGMFDQALSGIENRAKNKVKEKLASVARTRWTSWTCWRRCSRSPPTPPFPRPRSACCCGARSGWSGCSRLAGTPQTGPIAITGTWTPWRTPSLTCGSSPRW